jgi:hypothetical protein
MMYCRSYCRRLPAKPTLDPTTIRGGVKGGGIGWAFILTE